MDKSKYFLNLSNCTKEEIKEIYKKIKNSDQNIHTQTKRDLINGIVTHCYWFLFFDGNAWNQNKTSLSGRAELTYPEFIKLFEGGGETDEKGRPMTYWGGKENKLFDDGEGENQPFTKEDIENAYRAGENKQTYYFKDTTVILPTTYEGVDG